LPYHSIVYVDENLPRLKLGAATRVWEYIAVDKPCKPYLRPMSSMTEEEKKEFESFGWMVNEFDDNYPWVHIGQIENVLLGLDWLNKHHFDYRGLIERGLALEAPEGMYN
jgi:hypothetical protein